MPYVDQGNDGDDGSLGQLAGNHQSFAIQSVAQRAEEGAEAGRCGVADKREKRDRHAAARLSCHEVKQGDHLERAPDEGDTPREPKRPKRSIVAQKGECACRSQVAGHTTSFLSLSSSQLLVATFSTQSQRVHQPHPSRRLGYVFYAGF